MAPSFESRKNDGPFFFADAEWADTDRISRHRRLPEKVALSAANRSLNSSSDVANSHSFAASRIILG